MLVTMSGGNVGPQAACAIGWWKLKWATCCGRPFSGTLKSSAFRSVIGLPLPSVATTAVTTRRVLVRGSVSDCATSLF